MASNTKQKLIETATDLIWQSSYGSVSVDDICKAAGVRKGSFYHFFPSKVDLALAALEEHFRQNRVVLDTVFSASVPPLTRFENMADFVLEIQEQALEKYGRVCGCPFASIGCEMAGQDETIRQKTDDIFTMQLRYCENALRDATAQGVIRENTDVNAMSVEICSYVMGQMMMARIQNSLEAIRRDLKDGMFRIMGVKELEDA